MLCFASIIIVLVVNMSYRKEYYIVDNGTYRSQLGIKYFTVLLKRNGSP